MYPSVTIAAIVLVTPAVGAMAGCSDSFTSAEVGPDSTAVGATCDAGLAQEYGAGLGREFRTKGANVILGPSVNVHRVPRNGRNGEYLSGEEPLLGAVLGAAVVRRVRLGGQARLTTRSVQ